MNIVMHSQLQMCLTIVTSKLVVAITIYSYYWIASYILSGIQCSHITLLYIHCTYVHYCPHCIATYVYKQLQLRTYAFTRLETVKISSQILVFLLMLITDTSVHAYLHYIIIVAKQLYITVATPMQLVATHICFCGFSDNGIQCVAQQ